ncbi:MerR family transcriptional regulator [Paenibacillus silvae]|uniref:MerR family transcriptional regulator n=1 Tax=Paenibacillus silvae TaxID=1325358 RepID=UPI001F0CC46C|nr:MerR family transcriptional regulator [Paenibacillus silvae]
MYIHINELARRTEITVRTLRYYDSIGLLRSSSKTEGGHRLYVEEDLKKLQQIQFLKNMGYALKDIHEMLSDTSWNWEQSLRNQLHYIIEEQQRLQSMELSVREMLHSLVLEQGDQHEAIEKLIQLSRPKAAKLQSLREALFHRDELELWKKLPRMQGNDPHSLEWIALLGQLKSHLHEPPACDKVQSIIRRMMEKQQEDFGGQDDFLNKLWEARKSTKTSDELGLYPLEPELLDYMEAAYDIFISNESEQHNGY